MSQTIKPPANLRAELPSADVLNGRNYSGEKELVSVYSLMAIDANGDLEEIVDCRCWMGRSRNASVVYAAIWIHGNGRFLAGHGKAGGYGYHKESAAIDEAITSAGISLFGSPYNAPDGDPSRKASIAGVGDSAIHSALAAIGAALGYEKMSIVTH